MGRFVRRRLPLAALLLALSGYGGLALAASPDGRQPAGYHQVAKGETLYSIAFLHGLDYRELASVNGVKPPFIIRIGQRLRLPRYKVKRGETLYGIALRYGLDYRELAEANGIKPPFTIQVGQELRLSRKVEPRADSGPEGDRPQAAGKSRAAGKTAAKAPPGKAPSASKAPAKAPPAKPPTLDKPQAQPAALRFAWPVKGKLLSRFSLGKPVNKGIDIAGKKGAPVVAAAAGEVVYAGGNLRGYGKLVIIKHNDKFLSAYGNNDKILVKEKDRVQRGERIARMGADAAKRAFLHFEIREDGKPQNPLKYLPR